MEKLVLFGSTASETSGKDSDIDLLVIKESPLRRDERDIEVRKLLKDIIYPMDIFVYTPDEVKTLKAKEGSFINKILNTGKVLYERRQPKY